MKSFLRVASILVVMCFSIAIMPNAQADTFSVDFTSGGSTVAGTLMGSLISPGVYAITGGSVTLTDSYWAGGNGVYSLVPDPSSPNPTNSTTPVNWFTYDDLLTPNAANGEILDGNGLYFYDSTLGLAINIWGNGPGQPYTWELADSNGYRDGGNGAFYITPEPGTLFLFGTGLLGLALMVFRSARSRLPSAISNPAATGRSTSVLAA